jgi:hypothetical protein
MHQKIREELARFELVEKDVRNYVSICRQIPLRE